MEPSELIQIIVGTGLISAIGSGIITYWTTRRISREERAYARNYEKYFSDGLYPVEAALSEYGTALVLSLHDLGRGVFRVVGKAEAQMQRELQSILDEIKKRERVADLIEYDYRLATRSFPRLQTFGMELYNAIKRTFHIYSLIIRDVTRFDLIMPQIQESSEDFKSGLKAISVILQDCEVYLERRLRQLDVYVSEKECKSDSDFLKLIKDSLFGQFRQELRDYTGKVDAWRDALSGGPAASKKREETSLALSKWLSEHIDVNPFKPKELI